jgi:predicted PurR-regulated permease PerM
MRKLLSLLVGIIYLIALLINFSFAQYVDDIDTYSAYENKPISNTNSDSVINEQNLGDDPLRQSLRDVGSNIEGIAYQDIENSDQAQKYTMDYIKKIFDYFIALLALIVLVYMLYNFFIMLTASGQDEKYKK